MPAFTGNFRCSYLWKEKLYTYIDINGIAGAYARDKNMNAVAIKGAADINIGANYQFHKNFSVFLDAKNLAHMKYQNWYLYPQFGANVMLGVKFSY
jgi:outer membrane receptor protein involved in Fe transport